MKGALALRKNTAAPIVNDNSGSTVPTASYLQLDSALDASVSALRVSNTSAKAIYLAVGASGSEVIFACVPPGALESTIPVEIAKGARLAAKAVSADATTGLLIINLMG